MKTDVFLFVCAILFARVRCSIKINPGQLTSKKKKQLKPFALNSECDSVIKYSVELTIRCYYAF